MLPYREALTAPHRCAKFEIDGNRNIRAANYRGNGKWNNSL